MKEQRAMVHKDAVVTEGTEKPSEKDNEGKINDVMTGPQEDWGEGPGRELRPGEWPRQAQSCMCWTS